MKTTRLVLGIIGMVLFLIIIFQSCAAGIVEAFEDDTESTASAAGVIVGLLFLIAGIVAVCTRKSVAGGYICGGMYALSGIIGIAGHGLYEDLIIWSVISLIYALVFIITSIIMKKRNKASQEPKK